jgi:preprotein translocase subunit SecG
MYQALLVIYLLLAVSIIVLVLLQQGKGAVLGAASAGGASTTLFGATGSNRFMSQLTAVLMGLFFALCLLLGNLTHSRVIDTPWHDLSEPVVAPLEQQTLAVPAASPPVAHEEVEQ